MVLVRPKMNVIVIQAGKEIGAKQKQSGSAMELVVSVQMSAPATATVWPTTPVNAISAIPATIVKLRPRKIVALDCPLQTRMPARETAIVWVLMTASVSALLEMNARFPARDPC